MTDSVEQPAPTGSGQFRDRIPEAAHRPPEHPVEVAIIGAGRWGPNLIRNFHEDRRSNVRWVIDINKERQQQVHARYPDARQDADFTAVLEDPEVDAVVIATPATTHAELASRALRKGKHCFVEKPLALSVETATELCDLADEQDLVLAVGHVFLYNPAVVRIKRYIENGDLGNLRYVSTIRTNLGPPDMDVNVAWDLATHDVSIANYWLESAPVAASATGGRWISNEREDTIFATLRYPSGCLVHLNASWLNPVKTRTITVVGDRKMATLDDMLIDEPIRLYDKGIDPGPDDFIDSFGAFRSTIREGDVTIPHISKSEPLREECGKFIESVLSHSPPVADGRSALPVIAAIEAITASVAAHGTEITVVYP